MQANPLHETQVAAAEKRTYGAAQAALGGNSAVAAAVAASAFPSSGVTLPIIFHGKCPAPLLLLQL